MWTNAGILLIGPLGTNFSGILIKIHTFLFNKMHLKIVWKMAALLSQWQCVNRFRWSVLVVMVETFREKNNTGLTTCSSSQHKDILTHWDWDKMAAIIQTTISNAFSWVKILEFRLKFHRSLFPRVQLTIYQHWLKQWRGADQATSHYLNHSKFLGLWVMPNHLGGHFDVRWQWVKSKQIHGA